MTVVRARLRNRHVAPRVGAVVLVLLAAAGFHFISHEPSRGATYGPVQDRAYVLFAANNVVNGVEAQHRTNALPIPVARTVADMRAALKQDGPRVRVVVHGANIMVTFPKQRAVCVWVPVIVYSPKDPAIVSC